MHAMERRIRIDSSLATGAKDSSKSMPSTWVYPWATNLDLFRTTSPSSSFLFLKIHLVLMTCVSLGLGTSSHTSFLTNWCNSWCMDFIQFSSSNASSTFFNSNWTREQFYVTWFTLYASLFLNRSPSSNSPMTLLEGWLRITLDDGLLGLEGSSSRDIGGWNSRGVSGLGDP